MAISVCLQPGCLAAVSKPHFLCPCHWGRLPARIQRGMMERANAWKDRAAAVEFLRSYQRATGVLKGGCR